jgi:acetyl esterase/lipase
MNETRFDFSKLTLLWLMLLLVFVSGCLPRLPKTIQTDKNIEYGHASGQTLLLDIYRPRQIQRKLPAIVWLYGGAWKMGNKSFCPIAFMATQQVAIVSINYRLDRVAPFPAQIYDCKGAVRWLRAHADKYNLDPDHIGIFGASAGGHLAALLGTTAGDPKMEGEVGGNLEFSNRVQCVCAFYPPTDLNRLVSDPRQRVNPDNDVARLIGGPVADNVAKANFASPIFYVNKNSAPFFLMHGGADKLVSTEQSEIFYAALKQAGVEAHLEIVPDKGHGIIAPPNVAQKIYQFFDKYLDTPDAGQKTRHSELPVQTQ